MKTLAFKAKFGSYCGLLLLAGFTASAQMPASGMSGAMLKLFGNITAFSAKAEVQVLDKDQSEVMKMPLDFSLLENKIRIVTDLSQMKSRNMPPGTASSLKQMGLAQIISIIRPDQQAVWVLYPDQKCLLKMAMSKADAEAARTSAKLEKTPLGNETIDGHPCIKQKVVLVNAQGGKVEATTWNATDLKDFPVQIQTQENGNTSFMRFKQVQFVKPDARQFEPPAGYTQYNDQQEMIMALTRKIETEKGK